MKLLSVWLSHFKHNYQDLHKVAVVVYYTFPMFLVASSLYDGLPIISVTSPSMFSSILLGMGILFVIHITLAGTMHSFDEGQSQKATTIGFYGAITILCLILLVP